MRWSTQYVSVTDVSTIPQDVLVDAQIDGEWEATERALILLRKAVERDPNFSRAMATAIGDPGEPILSTLLSISRLLLCSSRAHG